MYVPVFSLLIDDPADYEISESFSCDCLTCNLACPCASRFSAEKCSEVIPRFECNQNCKCKVCENNKLKTSKFWKVSIRATKSKGLGVFAEESIPKNAYVGEYAGRVVNQHTEGKYVFQLRENTPKRCLITTIDAEYFGNFTRFLNHSCEPNLEVVAIRNDYIIPHIVFIAQRDIEIGEELCFKYRENTTREHKCLCGSQNCIGYF